MTSVPLLSDIDALALTGDGLAVLGGRTGTGALHLDLDRLWD
ncbi:hypothetical protein GCM10010193_39790 [Kitasatospora atroaurantiaca]|uniref:NERD domain-containing protein n=1 Tax=Kitasatospora atroaurantiaca TaxID=285545 RepID=A0A561EKU7_9ACTN|nr:hypothetical protein [Kitasatospora atroaurantiaca]TWE16246.1 hypothetical protein FB465_1223 [Kitasatospora atroaurantiaca]